MLRPIRRRRPSLESLEQRQALSTTPTGGEQYLLELINQARTDPSAAAERIEQTIAPETLGAIDQYNVDLQQALDQIADATPRPPVAWDANLAKAAEAHSEDQVRRGVQSHYGPNGETLSDRLDDAGYDDFDLAAENVMSKARSEDEAMQAFLIDWNNPGLGHRKTIQQPDSAQPDLTEVGVAVVKIPTKQWNPFLGAGDESDAEERVLVTQVFGRPKDAKPKVLGVVYRDDSGDAFYTEGEGVANATIRLENVASGQKYTASSWSAGGYQVEVPSGTYRVTGEVGGKTVDAGRVTVGTENVKVDFDLKRTPTVAPATPSKPATAPSPTPSASKPAPIRVVNRPAPAVVVPATPPVEQSFDDEPASETPSIVVRPAPIAQEAPESNPPATGEPAPSKPTRPTKFVVRNDSALPRSLSLLIRYRASAVRRSFPMTFDSPAPTVVSSIATSKPTTFRFWRA